jgi:peptidoglycan/LPS O-acetylase OafA/YrhL
VIAMIANTPERTRTADNKQSEAHSFGAASRVQSLDGLRAVSITLVITGHLIFSLPTTHPLPRYLSFTFGWGNTGVVIFFGISGYIITNLLLQEIHKTGKVDFLAFFLRRALRILPPLWLFLALSWLFADDLSAWQYLAVILFVTDYVNVPAWIEHTWSLSVEEQFYLLWPWVIANLGSRRSINVALLVMLIAPLMRTICLSFNGGWGFDTNFHLYADAIAVGCILALVQDAKEMPAPVRLLGSPWCAVMSVLFLAVGLPLVFHVTRIVGSDVRPLALSIRALAVASIIAWAVAPSSRNNLFCKFLNWGPIVHVGIISYSLYLFQQPFFTSQLKQTAIGRFPLNILIPFLLAECSFHIMERPLREWGRMRIRRPCK